ncbi:UNVERIFIED_CONTAM: hypothetical protein FKN15_036222 [Acipenser sinensis]
MNKCYKSVIKGMAVNSTHVKCTAHFYALIGNIWQTKFAFANQTVASVKKSFKQSAPRKLRYRKYMSEKTDVRLLNPNLVNLLDRNDSLLASLPGYTEGAVKEMGGYRAAPLEVPQVLLGFCDTNPDPSDDRPRTTIKILAAGYSLYYRRQAVCRYETPVEFPELGQVSLHCLQQKNL